MGTVTEYYRVVQKILDDVKSDTLREFSLLTSDEERVSYVMRLPAVKETFCIEPRYLRKSLLEAKNHREAGNRLYKEAQFTKALNCYNNAVLYAPWPKVVSLPGSETSNSIATMRHNGGGGDFTIPSDLESNSSSKPTDVNTVVGNGLSETSDYVSESTSTTSSQYRLSSKAGSIVTQSDSLLAQADPEFSELPLALGNRSATLYQLRECSKCIEDIDLALQLGFPLHLRYKLFDRKARCFIELKQHEEAIQHFERVKTSLVASNLTVKQREKVVQNCEKQIDLCKQAIKDSETSTNDGDSKQGGNDTSNLRKQYVEMVVTPIENKSKMFPCAADALEVRYKDLKGRYGVAKHSLSTGDVLLNEEPYCSVLEVGCYEKRCYHCFLLLPLSPFSCQSCSGVRYCTTKCRQLSWKSGHKWECHYLGLLHASGTGVLAHLALRTVFKAGWSDIVKCCKNSKSKKQDSTKSLYTKNGVFLAGFASLHNLLPHTESRPLSELFQYTILAVFLLKIARYTDFLDEVNQLTLKEKEKLNGFSDITLGGVLLKFLQIIACNGIEVTEMSVGSNLQKTNPDSVGLALYPTVSLLNHSCNPALELIFYNNHCVARPIRNIPANAELTIDYGYIYYAMPKEQRQTNLRSQYHFRCDCEACVLNWSIKNELSDGIPPLKCIYCQVPLMLYGQNNPLEVVCENCNAIHNPIEYFQKLTDSSKKCEQMIERARMFEIQDAIPHIERHIALLEEYVLLPWKEYTLCVSTLKQCYRMLGNVSRDVKKQLKMNRFLFDT